MTMTEAMRERHTVRKYTDKALPQEIIEKLNARIDENNSRFGLEVKLITDSADGLNLFAKLAAKGVKNYFVLAADGGEEAAAGADRKKQGDESDRHHRTAGGGKAAFCRLPRAVAGGGFSRKIGH